ncbi:MAG: hypothetical protein DRN17_04475 [Thermoplasmata archaeon]|nr:MAG: hypothetical protein DRN17_04475 [Thermoplasmata archaeon]
MPRDITIMKVKEAIREKFKDAQQISEETGIGNTAVYASLRELKKQGAVEIDSRGLKTVYKLREGAILQNPKNEENPKNSKIPAVDSNVVINGHGIKVVKYDPTELILDKKAVLSSYHNRKLNGIQDFDILEYALQNKKNVLFYGEKGSGKSAMARAFAAHKGLPYFRINLDGMVTAEDLLGQWVRAGDDWAWSDGVLTMAMRHGGVFVIDEINAGSPEVNFVFQSALDDDRQIILRNKDNEVVKAHPNFLVIANMNPDYEGTRPLNEALEDRFDMVIEVDYDNRIERKLIKDNNLLELAKRIRKMHRSGEITRTISTRSLLQFQENKEAFGEKFAIQSLISKFEKEDRRAIEETAKQVLGMNAEEEITEEEGDGNE